MDLKFINLSRVIGGQEIYLYNFLEKLGDNNVKFYTDVDLWETNNMTDLYSVKYIHLDSITYKSFLKIKRKIQNNTSEKDIIVFNGNRAIYLGALVSKKYKKIAIQHSSIIDAQDGRFKRFLRVIVYRLLLNRYDKLIGVSENTINPIKSSEKVFVVKNGIEIEKFYPISYKSKLAVRDTLGFKETDKLLLMVGTLTNNKGQFEAIKIIENLEEEYKLILVGDGPERKYLENDIAEKELEKRIILVGKIKNVVDYYWISDALLCLSRNEGLPLTILEAMSTGLPILTTRVGGIPEVIENNKNGIFIDREAASKTAKSIKRLLNDKAAIHHIRENNINKIKHEYTLDNCVQGLIEHIEEL